ncbi:MAG: hypothetical protein H6Q67_1621 [Firmicutes bacterium]|nr:hypothetical protein [Bacillota bacterium]
MKNKFWKIKNATDGAADLQLYGTISDESWWGDEVTPKQFAEDLKNLGDIATLNVHINSGGGDVFAGIAIHSILKAHPAAVNVHVDGLAASIASVIAMAGNKIIMPAGSMMMIHNPAGYAGYCEAEELRKMADTLDTIKDAIMDIYADKCGKTKDDIATIMNAETWYTAQMAVDNGFATETDTAVSYAASLDKKCLKINGCAFDTTNFKNVPKIANQVSKVAIADKSKIKKEEIILDINEFKEKYPDLYKDVYSAGVKAGTENERTRMKSLDEVVMPGHEALVNKARYETGESAEVVAMAILKAERAVQASTLTNLEADAATSGISGINASPVVPGSEQDIDAAEVARQAAVIAKAANRGRVN